MRHFGNAHYGGWYKSKSTSHKRYYDFLLRLKSAFDARGLYRKRDAVSSMIGKIAAGKSPKTAQQASKTANYSPPLFSEFNSMWEESQDTDAIVDYFADGGVAPTSGSSSDPTERTSGTTVQGMIISGAERAGMTKEEFVAQMRAGGGGTGDSADLSDDEILATYAMEEEDESFFSQYKVPIVAVSALALAGGAYYFFVVRD